MIALFLVVGSYGTFNVLWGAFIVNNWQIIAGAWQLVVAYMFIPRGRAYDMYNALEKLIKKD